MLTRITRQVSRMFDLKICKYTIPLCVVYLAEPGGYFVKVSTEEVEVEE